MIFQFCYPSSNGTWRTAQRGSVAVTTTREHTPSLVLSPSLYIYLYSINYRWRSPTVVGQGREKTPASGFLDGDFLESFRSYSEDIRQEVLDGKNEFERLRGEERRIQDCLEEVRQLH